MASVVNLEKRLVQLQAESRILERLVYKGKNQHRRCIYFQYLLKVRRDVGLLQSAGLEQILKYVSQLMDSKKPKETVWLLESLKKRKHNDGKPNFQERLLGIARLLSQMVEPMVKAAMEISRLLAQSFFMGFSVTILALLARLRVLVQQILLDVVSVFNSVSSISQKEHSVKLIQEGVEVLRDYYPAKEVPILECEWKTDKFVLLERTNKIKDQDGDPEVGREFSLGTSNIQYQTIDAFLGEDAPGCKMGNDNSVEDLPGATNPKRHKADTFNDQPVKLNGMKQPEDQENNKSHTSSEGSLISHVMAKGGKPLPFRVTEGGSTEKECTNKSCLNSTNDNEDPFLSLLIGRNMKSSLY